MTLIKPQNDQDKFELLKLLTVNVAQQSEINVKPYDANAVKDNSGETHWMYVFDEHESRLYRIQNGCQQMVDIDVDSDGFVDLDRAEQQVETAIKRLAQPED